MEHLKRIFSGYHLPVFFELSEDEFVVLLSKDERYSVCKVYPKRKVVMSPNFVADGVGIISGPMQPPAIAELLQWTDRDTASQRYLELCGLQGNVHPLLH